MGEPEIISIKPESDSGAGAANSPALDRLRIKAKALKGPRGKYRCRKCHELPCVCVDPKQSTPAPETPKSAPQPSTPLFTEKASKRLLEATFGIPTVLTQCRLWALTEEEALELSKPTTDVLNEFVTVDPKWVALTVLSVSLGSIVARKAVLYTGWKRAMAAQRMAEPQRVAPEPAPSESPNEYAGEPETNGVAKPGPSGSIDMLQ